MTVQDFITEIQGLYGQYNQFQRNHVTGWASSKRPDVLDSVLRFTIENVSWTHNKRPPGLAEFNNALKEIRKHGEIDYYTPPMLDEPELPTEEAEAMFEEIKRLAKEKKVKP
jgi:hypothetical protein